MTILLENILLLVFLSGIVIAAYEWKDAYILLKTLALFYKRGFVPSDYHTNCTCGDCKGLTPEDIYRSLLKQQIDIARIALSQSLFTSLLAGLALYFYLVLTLNLSL